MATDTAVSSTSYDLISLCSHILEESQFSSCGSDVLQVPLNEREHKKYCCISFREDKLFVPIFSLRSFLDLFEIEMK